MRLKTCLLQPSTENEYREFALLVTTLQRFTFLLLLMPEMFRNVLESPIFYFILTFFAVTKDIAKHRMY